MTLTQTLLISTAILALAFGFATASIIQSFELRDLRGRVSCLERPYQASSIGPVTIVNGRRVSPPAAATVTGCRP